MAAADRGKEVNKVPGTLIKTLISRIKGRVLTDPGDLKKFSRDQSIYYLQPAAVVIPESSEDIIEAVQWAAGAGIAVTPRGGGSGTAGAGLGTGIMVAFDRKGPINRILDFKETEKTAEITVEAGILHSRMQAYLRERGLFLPADPSSSDISLVGGNIATKASGPHALKHGSIDRYLRHLCFVGSRGEWIDTAAETTIPRRITDGLLRLKQAIKEDQETVRRLKQRAHCKIASGYNLFAFLPDLPLGELVAQLLAGSVGTLGILTRATFKTEPYIQGRATMVISFTHLHEAGDAVQYIRDLGVATVEIISRHTLEIIKERRRNAFATGPTSAANGHLLLVEFEGEERLDQVEAVKKVLAGQKYRLESAPFIAADDVSQAQLWKERQQLLPVILNTKPPFKALSVVNDVGVAVTHLAEFILEIEAIFHRFGLKGAIYGHAGSGNLHLRPLFDTSRRDIKTVIQRLADEVYRAVFKYDGTITAEHGMGRLRAPYLEQEWGRTIIDYMKQLKHIFDPEGLFNPGAMFAQRPLTTDMMRF